jgi:hypothetical protein
MTLVRWLKMPHSWKAFDIARLIVEQLLEASLIKSEDALRVQGIIQIILEEKRG